MSTTIREFSSDPVPKFLIELAIAAAATAPSGANRIIVHHPPVGVVVSPRAKRPDLSEAVEKIKKAEAEVAEAAPSTFGDLLKAAAEGEPPTKE